MLATLKRNCLAFSRSSIVGTMTYLQSCHDYDWQAVLNGKHGIVVADGKETFVTKVSERVSEMMVDALNSRSAGLSGAIRRRIRKQSGSKSDDYVHLSNVEDAVEAVLRKFDNDWTEELIATVQDDVGESVEALESALSEAIQEGVTQSVECYDRRHCSDEKKIKHLEAQVQALKDEQV